MIRVGLTNSMTSTTRTCITTAQRTLGRIKSLGRISPCSAASQPMSPSTCKRRRSFQRAWPVVCFSNLARVDLKTLTRFSLRPKNSVLPSLVAKHTSTCSVSPLENFNGTTKPSNGSKTGMTTTANSPQSVARKRAVGLPVSPISYSKLLWFYLSARA